MKLGNDDRHLSRPESFEIRERQITAKGQSGGTSSAGQARAQLCAAVRERKWELKPQQKRPRMSHFITVTPSRLSLYKKKDALPCRSLWFSAKRGGLGPAAALTHLLGIWLGQKLLHPPSVLSHSGYRVDPWPLPAITRLGTIKAMVLLT